MKIKVLGPGCARCHQLEQTTREAVKELGIDVEIEADNKEDARMNIIENIEDYADQMVDGSCYVSNGDEIQ